MSNSKKNDEFQRLIKAIYGNSELDRRTKKLLEYTWKTNPDIIRLTAKQKTNITSLNELELPKIQQKTVSDIDLSLSTSIQDIVPQRRSDDFSGMNFSEAFRKARQLGLNTFKWNSGIYGTELAKELKPELKSESKSESEDTTIELPEVMITPTDSIKPVLSDSIAIPTDSITVSPYILRGEELLNNYHIDPDFIAHLAQKNGLTEWTDVLMLLGLLDLEGLNQNFSEFLSLNSKLTSGLQQNVKKLINWLRRNNVGRRVDRHDNYIYTTVGRTSSYQQGGQLTMNEQQLLQAFIQYLAQKTGAKTQEELEAVILQLGEEGLKLAYAEFMQLIQQLQVRAAKFGAKLNYIKSLRGQCPEGYEISYYKVGGTLCKKCMKKQKEMKKGGTAPKDAIDEFKQDKMKKKAQGGGVNLNNGKCKKKEDGGELNSTRNPKSFSKMTLAKCGTKLKEACKGIKLSDGNKIKSNATGGAVSGKKLCKKKASGGTVSTPNGTYFDSKGTKWKPGKKYNPKG